MAALLGGALAVVLAATTLPAIVHAAPAGLPRLDEVALTGRTPALRAAGRARLRCRLRDRGRAARRVAGPGPPSRGRPRLDGAPPAGPRRAGGGPDRDGARAADRRGAADAQLPGPAARSIPATTRATSSRSSSPRSRPLSRTARPGRGSTSASWTGWRRCPASTSVGLVENVPLDEGTARRPLPQRGHARRTRRRPAASPSPSRPATTSAPWASTSSRAGLRDRRSRLGPRQRRGQPLRGPAVVARPERRRPTAPAAGRQRTGTPSWASWRT